MKFKILIGPSSFAESDSTPMDRLLSAGYEVVDNPYKRKMTKSEVCGLLQEDVVGILAGLEPLDREVLQGSHLRVVSRVGAGMNNVDVEAAGEMGIAVFNTPDGPTNAVAELTVGAMLGLLRSIPQSSTALHDRKWARRMGGQIEGRTVAIVGFGRIGRRVAELLAPFRARLIIVDPCLEEAAALPYRLLPLNEALSQADIVTIHAGGEVRIFDETAFSVMKRGALLLNAARGGIVSEKALIGALDAGIVAGAWLDTFEAEPYAGPLCGFENVIMTPHVGSYTSECRRGMENDAVSNLLKGLKSGSR